MSFWQKFIIKATPPAPVAKPPRENDGLPDEAFANAVGGNSEDHFKWLSSANNPDNRKLIAR